MTDNFAHLEESEFKKILRLREFYYCEARICQDAQAYIAGCVMLGAALEANLVAMVAIFQNDVATCKSLPHGKRRQPLLQWGLGKLLRVANELGWLPAYPIDGTPDPKDWSIGAHAQVVRILRNLVHPGRYLNDFPNYQITADELTASFKVLDGIHLHLSAALSDRMRKAVKQGSA